MNILTFTSLFPNGAQPNFGVFVKHRAAALAQLPGVQMRVVAPVPYFPKQLNVGFVPAHWRRMANLPEQEIVAGLPVWHPRFFNPPKVGMRYYAKWMAAGALATVRRLHAEQPFDLIDAHYVYPDGAAAVRLGQALGIPVCVTARGTDINLFSTLPHIRPLIVETLQGAQGIIAVSEALKTRMVELGIDEQKIAVIRNGIDPALFHWREQAAARLRLGLAQDRKICVTVGALIPAKGIDRLIDALALVPDPRIELYVIGAGGARETLQQRIQQRGLAERVKLLGAKPQAELLDWYAAADLFLFASLREGCPNVIIEALACGLPIVAVNVGGIGELVTDAQCGLLVAEHEPQLPAALAECIAARLAQADNRQALAARFNQRDWVTVAREQSAYLRKMMQS